MKRGIEDLAAFGGVPAFQTPVHVGRPNIGDRNRLMARFSDMLDRRWLTNDGPFVQELERRISDFLGVKHCIAICNGTVALEIAIRALDLKGDVIVPSYTFIATAHALQWQQITPVFCDVDPSTHTIDPAKAEELITERTSGIIGVHLWGMPSRVDELERLARKYRISLMFDAAHAFACSFNGRMVGSFGELEVFSFHATKFFNALEGGAIATNSDDLAEKIRLMRNFGFAGYDRVIYIGTNGKMTEASAAMGLTSLESIDEFIATNRSNYLRYAAELADVPGLRLKRYGERGAQNYQYIVVEVDETVTGLSRDEIVALLHDENVLARRYFYPGCHRMEPYRSTRPDLSAKLPVTCRLAESVLALPTGTAVSEADIRVICSLLRTMVAGAEAIRVCRSAETSRSVTEGS